MQENIGQSYSIDEDNLFILLNPFSNDSKPIKLNLIIIDSFFSGDIDKNFGQFIYYGKAEKYLSIIQFQIIFM